MKYILCAALVLLIVLVIKNDGIRFLKTIYLIARVSPYEQSVIGGPSILVLGDSTGYGTGATRSTESIAGLIGRDFPAHSIVNNSKNGRTIGELVPAAQSVTGDHELILLQIGGNDILQKRGVRTVEAELRKIISELESKTEHIVMISSGNVGGAAAFEGEVATEYEQLTRNFRNMFKRVSAETSLVYVDLFLEPEVDMIANNPDVYLSIDGLHPSSAGYAYWYESLKPRLSQSL